MAIWLRGSGDDAVPFGPELSERIEVAYQSFWSQGTGRAIFELKEACIIDFRLLEQRHRPAGAAVEQRVPVSRRESWAVASSEAAFRRPAAVAEWGHGQDVVEGRAFSPYNAEIIALLEDSYERFKTGNGLKGILFTAANGADYLVDFVKMQQVRQATRNVRPVYRHSVGLGVRESRTSCSPAGGAAAAKLPAPPSPAGSRPSVDSEDPQRQRSDSSTWLAATWCLDPVALWNLLVGSIAGKRV